LRLKEAIHFNGLEEVPPEEDNDDELIDAVRLVLEKNPFVNASTIRVNSKDWIVTLEGSVPTEAMTQTVESTPSHRASEKRALRY
jgi:hypothetical protein